MIDSELLKGLQTAAIAAIQGLPEQLPIHAVGVPFTPPNDKKYFQLVVVPFDAPENWDDGATYVGMLNIILYWPVDGAGIYSKTDVLETLAKSFPKGRNIFEGGKIIRITERPRIGAPINGRLAVGKAFEVSDNGHDLMLVLSVTYGCSSA